MTTKDLPAKLKFQHEHVTLTSSAPTHTDAVEAATAYSSLGIDNSFRMSDFKENFDINILKMDDEEMVFEMSGIDAPIANALRRILLAEIPTMAIEQVYIQDNTSILPDEILAHRLGLIPILADPSAFDYVGPEDGPTFTNTLVFRLVVECSRNKKVPDDAPDEDKYINGNVYSKHLVWVPEGDQEIDFGGKIRPVHDDILIAKMRPGQRIELEAHVQKGIGKTHAKWSPVCTASYRLLPVVELKERFENERADELVATCPMGVFDIEDLGKVREAVVKRPRECTMCRECLRAPEMADKLVVAKKRDHFIFSVESTGIIPPKSLVEQALKILIAKCDTVTKAIEDLDAKEGEGEGEEEAEVKPMQVEGEEEEE
eukprot:c8079_g1_i1.p1 GENE.c8079_g1_i1~~c8079_g1_i1.p1  ORF type:complete len:395 (+),score=114.46 c8079_g1_i1:69-1187(+)